MPAEHKDVTPPRWLQYVVENMINLIGSHEVDNLDSPLASTSNRNHDTLLLADRLTSTIRRAVAAHFTESPPPGVAASSLHYDLATELTASIAGEYPPPGTKTYSSAGEEREADVGLLATSADDDAFTTELLSLYFSDLDEITEFLQQPCTSSAQQNEQPEPDASPVAPPKPSNRERNISIMANRMGIGGFEPQTLEKVSEKHGMTRERVRQIVEKQRRNLGNWAAPIVLTLSAAKARSGPVCSVAEFGQELTDQIGANPVSSGRNLAALCRYFGVDEPQVLTLRLGKLNAELLVWSEPQCADCTAAIAAGSAFDETALIEDQAFESLLGWQCQQEKTCSIAQSAHDMRVLSAVVNHFGWNGAGWRFDGTHYVRGSESAGNPTSTLSLARKELMLAEGPLHFTEIASRARARSGVSANDRAFHGALDRDPDVILWDRGTFIHQEFVPRNDQLMAVLWEAAFDRVAGGDIPYLDVSGLFDQFADTLHEHGVPHKTALYFLLERYDNESGKLLAFPKYPQIYLADTFAGRLSRTTALEQYVKQQALPFPKTALKQYARETLGLEEYQYNMALAETECIVAVSETEIAHWDNLELDEATLRRFADTAEALLEDRGQISVVALRDELLPEAIGAGLTSPELTYAALKRLDGHSIDTPGFPHVRLSDGNSSGTRSIRRLLVDYIAAQGGRFHSANLVREFTAVRQYNRRTVDQCISSLLASGVLTRSEGGLLVHAATAGIGPGELLHLEEILSDLLGEADTAGVRGVLVAEAVDRCHDEIELNSGFHWDEEIIKSLVRSFADYALIGYRYSYFVAAERKKPIHTQTDLAMDLIRGMLLTAPDLTASAALQNLKAMLVIHPGTGLDFLESLPGVAISESRVTYATTGGTN